MQFIVQPFEKGLKANPSWHTHLPFEFVLSLPTHTRNWHRQDGSKETGSSIWGITSPGTYWKTPTWSRWSNFHMCANTLCPGNRWKDVRTLLSHWGKSSPVRLKWKPASENSIDFKLKLRFPPSPHDPDTPNFTAKPAFLLYTWLGGSAHANSSYEFFDSMDMSDEEWEEWVHTES
jgi:hypothetical protein